MDGKFFNSPVVPWN